MARLFLRWETSGTSAESFHIFGGNIICIQAVRKVVEKTLGMCYTFHVAASYTGTEGRCLHGSFIVFHDRRYGWCGLPPNQQMVGRR